MRTIINMSEIINSATTTFEGKRIACKTSTDYDLLNLAISAQNAAMFDDAVATIATSDDVVKTLLSVPCVPQFAKVSQTEKGNAIRLVDDDKYKVVKYSDVVRYIRKHNKGENSAEIAIPFANADYVLFNCYGHNISNEMLKSVDMRGLSILADFMPDVACFKSASNAKKKEQLQMLFDTIAQHGKHEGEKVNAIERHTKLIAMEFVKYRGQKNQLNISNADKLIDLVICQYVNSRDHVAMTVKSSLDCHRQPKKAEDVKPKVEPEQVENAQ